MNIGLDIEIYILDSLTGCVEGAFDRVHRQEGRRADGITALPTCIRDFENLSDPKRRNDLQAVRLCIVH